MQSDRPIFVIGCPRSGTTMLQLMLHSHPRIAVPPETRFVVPGYYRRFSFGDLREEHNRRRLGRWIVSDKDTKFKELKLDGDQADRRHRRRTADAGLGDRDHLPLVRRAVRQVPLG